MQFVIAAQFLQQLHLLRTHHKVVVKTTPRVWLAGNSFVNSWEGILDFMLLDNPDTSNLF